MEGLSEDQLKLKVQQVDALIQPLVEERERLDAEIVRRAHIPIANKAWTNGHVRSLFAPIPEVAPTVTPKIVHVVDNDGYTTVSVCGKKGCKCSFAFKPADFLPGWVPKFNCFDKKGNEFIGTSLIVHGLSVDEYWEDSRNDIIAHLGKLRTCSINVQPDRDFAFVTCYNHKDAVKVREILTGLHYMVNFVCANLPKNTSSEQ